jgi:hypothetical protein
MITRVAHRHNAPRDIGIKKPDYLQYNSLHFATKWIRSLGSDLDHLIKVMIDKDPLCVLPCGRHCYKYDILPLACLFGKIQA